MDGDGTEINVDKLWEKDELFDMGYGQKKISSLPDKKLNILDQVLLLLLTVNDNEDNAALCYLEPLPGHDEIFRHHQRDDAGVQTQHAIYLIGKYGACPTAVRQIKPGAEIGGATTAPNLAFRCFKNLNAIIGMGVACGVEKEVKLCDVLVADKVNNYDQARLEQGGPLNRGFALPTSDLLSSIFRQKIMWLDSEIKKRLDECNVKPKIKQGIILSGPYLIDDIETKKELIQNFASEAIGIEMEAAYLFKGAQQVPTHMTIVKAVCDFGDGKKNKDFQPTAALLAANCVKMYLDEGAVKMLHKANPEVRGESHNDDPIKQFISLKKGEYKSLNKFGSNLKHAQNAISGYIELLLLVHKNPTIKTQHELHSKALTSNRGIETFLIEKEFSYITYATKDLSKIFQVNNNKLLKYILLEGAPGIGKTFLVKQIAYEWANGHLLNDVELLLLVYLRQPDLHEVKNFYELIDYCFKKDAKECADYFINKQGSNLMIIFDGYEELPKKAKIHELIEHLFSDSEVSNCYKMITSRPYITANLFQNVSCRIEISGITSNDVFHCIETTLDKKKCVKAKQFLKDNQIINSLCYIPFNLNTFIQIMQFADDNCNDLPKTQCELINTAICLNITRDQEIKKNPKIDNVLELENPIINKKVLQIAEFAYRITEKEQIVFTEEHLKQYKLNPTEDPNMFGLVQCAESNDPKAKNRFFNFIHFSVQEYLAAYHLSKCSQYTQYNILHQSFLNPIRYMTIWRMYTGITKGETLALQALLSGKSKMQFLMHLICFCKLKVSVISDKFIERKIYRSLLYLILLEAPDNPIRESLSTTITKDTIDFHDEQLAYEEINILAYLIARSYISFTWKSINLSNCSINDACCKNIYELLAIGDGRKKPVIEKLDLTCNDLSDFILLSKLVEACEITHLTVSKNSFKQYKLKPQQSSTDTYATLQFLDLSSNELQNDDLVNLCRELTDHRNLKTLILNDNKISDKDTKPLIKSIIQWNLFQEIKCKNNCFTDYSNVCDLLQFTTRCVNFSDASQSISFAKCLNKIDFLIIILGSIDGVIPERSNFVSSIKEIHDLNLSLENIGYSNSKILKPDKYSNYCSLAEALTCLNRMTKLTLLNLSGIWIDDEAGATLANALATNLKCLEKLCLNNCDVNSKIALEIGNALQSCKNIKEVELCKNRIDDKAIEPLAKLTLCLDLVELDGNEFSDEGFILLKMLKLDIQYVTINFSDKYFVTKSVIALFDYARHLPYKKQLQVKNNITGVKQLLLGLSKMCNHQQFTLTIDASCFFQNMSTICKLDLSGMAIAELAVDNLVKMFENNVRTLQCVVLNNCNLNSKIVIKCVQALQNVEKLMELQLSDNEINNEAANTIIDAILKWKSLEKFKADKNHFDKGYVYLENNFVDSFRLLLDHMQTVSINNLAIAYKVLKIQRLCLNSLCCNSEIVALQNKHFIKKDLPFHVRHSETVVLENGCFKILKDQPLHVHYKKHPKVFVQVFNVLTNLKEFDIRGIAIMDETCKHLCVTMQSLQSLAVIDCYFFNYTCLISFLREMLNVTSIQKFQFCKNIIEIRDLPEQCRYLERDGINIGVDITDKYISSCQTNLLSIISIRNKFSFEFKNNFMKYHLDYKNFVQLYGLPEVTFNTTPPNILKLNLSGICIDEETAENLFSNDLECLSHLIMNNCNLDSKKLEIILQKIQDATKMKELQFCDNEVDDEATESVIVAILKWKNSLKILEYRNNCFTDKSLNIISSVLNLSPDTPSDTVKHILKPCFANDLIKSVPLLLHELGQTSSTALDLSCMPLNSEHVTIVTDALKCHLRSLQILNLNGCNLTSICARSILESVNKSTLKKLDLSNNQLTSQVAISIKQYITDNTVLTKLYLANIKLGNDGIIRVAVGLASCQKLEVLDLSYNNITDEVAEYLCDAMKQLHQYGNLSSVNLLDNKISKRNLNAIYFTAGWKVWIKSYLTYVKTMLKPPLTYATYYAKCYKKQLTCTITRLKQPLTCTCDCIKKTAHYAKTTITASCCLIICYILIVLLIFYILLCGLYHS